MNDYLCLAIKVVKMGFYLVTKRFYLEIDEFDLFTQFFSGIPDLLAKNLMSFQNQIELSPNVFKQNLQIIFLHTSPPGNGIESKVIHKFRHA